jgi:TolB protein
MPELFTMDIASRKVMQLSKSGPALEIGAKYSPDGRSILASLTVGRESDIVQYALDGALLKKLTPPNGAIDVSPDWSPDGSKIVFCSDRAGGPQIYVMNADGSNPHRISFVTSTYCTSPDWSPKGDQIVFVCRADSGFQMFISDPDGGGARQLTSVGDNEDPDFSPDGRYIVFSTTFGRPGISSLAMMRSDGSNTRQLTQSRGGDTEPAWSPIVP